MTIFDILKVVTTKKGNRQELFDLVSSRTIPYSPFMINRWLSFLNPTIALYINEYCNKRSYTNPEEHLTTIYALLPKGALPSSMPRINYIKKPKELEEKEDPRLGLLAESLEISKKEAKMQLYASPNEK